MLTISGDSYTFEKELGGGGYAKVYEVVDKSGTSHALKKIKVEEPDLRVDIIKEMDILKRFSSHPNILTVEGYKMSKDCFYILLEKYDMSLYDYIYKTTIHERLQYLPNIFSQILAAMVSLHKDNVSHRDIKPENILLKKVENKQQFKVVICDFGISKVMNCSRNTPKVTTLWYRAPENLLNSNNYTKSIDVWGFGCVLYEYIYEEPLVKSKTKSGIIEQLCEKFGPLPISLLEEIKVSNTQVGLLKRYFSNHDLKNHLTCDWKDETGDLIPHVLIEILNICLQIKPSNRTSFGKLINRYYVYFQMEDMIGWLDKFEPKNPANPGDFLTLQNPVIINKYLLQTLFLSIFDIGKDYRLNNPTVFLAIDLVCRYLSCYEAKCEKEIPYLILSCLNIADKYYETNNMNMETLFEIGMSQFKLTPMKKTIRNKELKFSTFSNHISEWTRNILARFNFMIKRKTIFEATKNYELSKFICLDYEISKNKNERLIKLIKILQEFPKNLINKLNNFF
jgi:serine/threonine protein kinase